MEWRQVLAFPDAPTRSDDAGTTAARLDEGEIAAVFRYALDVHGEALAEVNDQIARDARESVPPPGKADDEEIVRSVWARLRKLGFSIPASAALNEVPVHPHGARPSSKREVRPLTVREYIGALLPLRQNHH
jgi:hypothetical protein